MDVNFTFVSPIKPGMKAKYSTAVWIISAILIWVTASCSAQKDVTERKNLMMPKKSEMSRNSRYREVEKRKTYSVGKGKKKSKSLF
jgi:hypothetical protein